MDGLVEPIPLLQKEQAVAVPVSTEQARKGNTWLVVLFSALIIIAFIVVVVLVSWGAISRYQFIQEEQRRQNLPTCTSVSNQINLVTIPADAPQCFQNGDPTSMYYIGRIDENFDYVVAPWPSSIQDVCVKFCNNSFSDGVCTGPNYAGKTAQQNYDSCMAQLGTINSGTCRGISPIASKGTILYYPQSPTCLSCDFCN